MSNSLSAKLARARFAFKDESICLDGQLNKMREGLLAQLVVARRLAEDTKAGGDRRMALNPVRELEQQIKSLEERMVDSTITIRFTAVNNGQWQKWILQNPPRKGNALDQNIGFNTDRFFPLVAQETGRYVVEPGTTEAEFNDAMLEDITKEQWTQIDEAMTAGDWDRVSMTLIQLNQKDGQRGPDFRFLNSTATPDSETPSDSPVT